jgi:hypothetical protein
MSSAAANSTTSNGVEAGCGAGIGTQALDPKLPTAVAFSHPAKDKVRGNSRSTVVSISYYLVCHCECSSASFDAPPLAAHATPSICIFKTGRILMAFFGLAMQRNAQKRDTNAFEISNNGFFKMALIKTRLGSPQGRRGGDVGRYAQLFRFALKN